MCLFPDYCTLISVIDPSFCGSGDKLKCLLFGKDDKALPQPNIGDVIRFHRLAVGQFLV